MKQILVIALAALGFAACKKNSLSNTDRTSPAGRAQLKLVLCNMTNPASVLVADIDGKRYTPTLAVTLPYPYPGGGYNTGGGSTGDYFVLDPGKHKVEYFVPVTGTPNVSSKFMEFSVDVAADKKYSLYTADSGAAAVSVLTPDEATMPADSGYMRLRVVNMMPNVPALDFYRNDTLIKENVPYKGFSEYAMLRSGLADTFSVVPAGTVKGYSKNALAYYRLALNTTQRIFSMVSSGYQGMTGVKAPRVSMVINR